MSDKKNTFVDVAEEISHSFAERHIGVHGDDRKHMLAALGVDSIEQLIDQVLPDSLKDATQFDFPKAVSEYAALQKLKNIAQKNVVVKSLIGQGYYDTITPAPILRNILENPGWYTAYTSYQSEISQGRLEALFNFQTMISDFTGLSVANASLLDESTALAEAVLLACRYSKKERVVVIEGLHEQNMQLLYTRLDKLNIPIEIVSLQEYEQDTFHLAADTAAVVMQLPTTEGLVYDISLCVQKAKKQEVLCIASIDPLLMTILGTPAQWGIDIVVGSTQRFGVPMGYGGPHAAFLACDEKFRRLVPGRLVGQSKDAKGRVAYRLALQTREQHIRREKATSNICTSQVLLAVMASMYAVYHGGKGLQHITKYIHTLAWLFWNVAKRQKNSKVLYDTFFDTITWSVQESALAQTQQKAALQAGYNIRCINKTTLSVSFDEVCTLEDVKVLSQNIFDLSSEDMNIFDILLQKNLGSSVPLSLPAHMYRNTSLLSQPIFNAYHTETELMRYMRFLMDKDLALDRSMIPLGSCTMKLNAVSELMPVSWQEFSHMHPYVPLDQTVGYQNLITQTESMLCSITGFDAVSLQPNAGSQGEYAGLLAISAYHRSNGDMQRNICLIPSSAHGTNPASAIMVGMKVVVVQCDEQGNIDIQDLQAKAEKYSEVLAALMVTYPSTHGVYEENIKHICDIVHTHGGQIYIDGANLNALVGIVTLTSLGADAAHMNLHKTFAIPHGGGGPGIGPVGVKKHLVPFLPANMLVQKKPYSVGPVSAAPWGSASILPISWMYMTMMGKEGLQEATKVAVLNANYVVKRLSKYYTILYTGKHGRVAHECILDTRPFKESANVMSTDIAKRLIDYGFHAPTMSWPVQNTLMIEPTESESKAELDRFCDAMISIREEIRNIENAVWARDDNPLVCAPHCAEDICSDSWDHSYTRQEAAYPIPSLYNNKYWPPLSRVDDAFGDKNLICSCPPIDEYEA